MHFIHVYIFLFLNFLFSSTNREVLNLLGAPLSVAAHPPKLPRCIPPHPQWTVPGAPWGEMLGVTTEPLPLLWPRPRSPQSPHSTDLDLIITLFRPQGYQVRENLNTCKLYIVWFKVETEITEFLYSNTCMKLQVTAKMLITNLCL